MPKLGSGQGEAKAEPGGKSRLQGAGQGGRAARGKPWGQGDPEIFAAPVRGTLPRKGNHCGKDAGSPIARSLTWTCLQLPRGSAACWLGGLGLLLPGALSG